ncbi:MAG: tetratricopeptide repeat protein [Armatimonadia bacterium]
MVLCPNCNARNANHSAFCIRCGATFASASPREVLSGTDAFTVQPEHTPEGLVDRAASHLAEGRAQAAVDDCKRAVALSPGEVQAYAVMAMAYEQLGEVEPALEAYETVVTLAPERTAERQKASLLRLRLGQQPPAPTLTRRAATTVPVWQVAYDWVRAKVQTNPPLYAGIASGLVVFMFGALLLVQTSHAQAAREVQARYDQEVRLADEAFAAQRYAEATIHYNAAYQLKKNDQQLQAKWRQAYDLSLQPVAQAEQPLPGQVAQYIPNPTGPNPFAPVPIGGPAIAPPAATPGAAEGALAGTGMQVPSVPVPSPTATRPPSIDVVRDKARTVTSTPSTLPSGRPRYSTTPRNPISAVPQKQEPKAPAPAATDTTPKTPKSEITIWVSDQAPARRPAAEPRPQQPDPQSLRAQGERLAREGRRDDAIQHLQSAASGFDARGDATSARAAATCRAQIEVLRNSNQ